MDEAGTREELLALTTRIVGAFVGHHAIAMGELPALLTNVF